MMTNKAPVILLLAVFFILVLTSVNMKSPICDEAGHHIAAGYSYVKTGDFRMNPSAPPLIRIIIGAPLLFLDLRLPTDHPSWLTINSTEFSRNFLFVYNKNAEKIVYFSRFPMILISLLLGILIFVWAKELYGRNAGLFALFLYVFSPAMLGNAGLAMLDMGCAFFLFLVMFQFRRYIKNKSPHNAVLCGITFGLAQSAKLTSIVLVPVFLAIAAVEILRARKDRGILAARFFRHMALIFLTGFFVLWATYAFEFKPLLKNAPDVEEKIEYIKKAAAAVPFMGSDKLGDLAVYFAENIPIPLSTYIVSFTGVAKSVMVGDQGLFFMGHTFSTGSKVYYAILYLIRTPLASLLLLFFAIVLLRRRIKISVPENLFLTLPIISIFLMASFSKLQGGLRYLLPLYPFLFVWMSGLITVGMKKFIPIGRDMFYILCLWYFLSSITAYPHYLAYFNELVGGSDGFAYQITADADWGQDFKELKKFLDNNGINSVKLLCFGTAEPSYYGIKYENLDKDEYKKPVPGEYYAISSRWLPRVEWADHRTPIARIAHTIFIYYINRDENTLKK